MAHQIRLHEEQQRKGEYNGYIALLTNYPFDTPKVLGLNPLFAFRHVLLATNKQSNPYAIAHQLDRVVKFPCRFPPALGPSHFQDMFDFGRVEHVARLNL